MFYYDDAYSLILHHIIITNVIYKSENAKKYFPFPSLKSLLKHCTIQTIS